MGKFIYKICNFSEWHNAQTTGEFKGTKMDLLDGFIHFSNRNQIQSTLGKYYFNKDKLVLLKVITYKLNNLVWEKSSQGELFPHLYSKLNLEDVQRIYKIVLNKDGLHTLPSNL